MHKSIIRIVRPSAVFAFCLAALAAGAHAQSVVFAGYGGAYQDNVAKALLKPAATKIGATLRQESHDNLSSVRVQVQSGKPGWDLVQLGSESCEAGTKEGLFEKLDYSQIDVSGIPPQMRADTWVGSSYFSVVLAWRTDKYKGNPPKNWADFWDTKKFPGRRAMSTYPQESMEIALLADGVAPDKLYPLNLPRAIKSLEKIKPSVAVWYKSGAQSAQLLKDGEVDMIAIWGSRIAPLVKDGDSVAYTFHQGLLNAACFAIPKGAK
ncbi:ABC transporter substrate-binding protein (plasmid) [Polaromonas sp. P1-6]|nr:ABC transporter substrate-binding protein [Polaromonas sp. P1-6]